MKREARPPAITFAHAKPKKDQNVSLQSAHEEGSLGSRAASAAL
jgi:hypothetical protein